MTRRVRRIALAACIVTSLGCDQRPLGLQPESTEPTWETFQQVEVRRRLSDVFAIAPDAIYTGYGRSESDHGASYTSSAVLRFDGSEWLDMGFTGSDYSVKLSIWASAEDHVYVADRSLYHFDGNEWSDVGVEAYLVAGTRPDDIYVINRNGLEHFDGSSWQTIGEIEYAFLASALAVAPGPLVAVEEGGAVHLWDGADWSRSARFGSISDLHIVSPTSIYAVGSANYYASTPKAWHFDGSEWSEMIMPSAQGELLSICGTGDNNLWAVGSWGLVMHYDGTSWQVSPRITKRTLRAVSSVGAARVIAVGDDEKAVEFDGSTWSIAMPDGPSEIRAAWVHSADRMVVLEPGHVYSLENGLWTEILVDGIQDYSGSVDASGPDNILVASSGSVWRYDGADWELIGESLGYFRDLAVLARDFVVGVGSGIQRYDGSAWHEDVSNAKSFNAVWASSPTNVIAVGSAIMHFDGSTWSRAPVQHASPFTGVWGSSDDNVLAVGPGAVYRFDGSEWRREQVPDSRFAEFVSGTGPNDTIILGRSMFAHFDGTSWRHGGSDNFQIGLERTSDGRVVRLFPRTIELYGGSVR